MITPHLLATTTIATVALYLTIGAVIYWRTPSAVHEHRPTSIAVGAWPIVVVAYSIAREYGTQISEEHDPEDTDV